VPLYLLSPSIINCILFQLDIKVILLLPTRDQFTISSSSRSENIFKMKSQKTLSVVAAGLWAIFLHFSLEVQSVQSADAIPEKPCEVDSDCLAGSFLVCNSWKVCSCPQGADLLFDQTTEKCARPIGSNCNMEVEAEPEPDEPICFSESACREFDWGSRDGKCSCNFGFKRNATLRTCSRSVALSGEECGP
jgi:hypothetical protein